MGLFSKITGMMINNSNSTSVGSMSSETLATLFIFYLVFVSIFVIAAYIYTSLAYSRLSKKTRTEPRWLVWIPFFRYYTVSKMARMHWWPMLLIIPILLAIPFFFISKIVALIFLIIGLFCAVVGGVFIFIWHWKIFERVGKPGWWVLLGLIPYAGGILFMVFLGIAAWSDKKYN